MLKQMCARYEEKVASYKPLAVELVEKYGVTGLTPKILLDALKVEYEEGIADTCFSEEVGKRWIVFPSKDGVGSTMWEVDMKGEEHAAKSFFDLRDTHDVQIVLAFLQRFNERKMPGFSDIAKDLVDQHGINGIDASMLLKTLGIEHQLGNHGICIWSEPGVMYLLTRYVGNDSCLEFEARGEKKNFDEVFELRSISDVDYALNTIMMHM